ncbi:MAG: hypothetical protein IT441_00470 [Phycisphaeraceae bacterium]|nr:hypothetical protein [Phycisphaeraceae bacterium]
MRGFAAMLAATTALLAAPAFGALSDNLVSGGDFEQLTKVAFYPGPGGGSVVMDYPYVKEQHSPRTADEVSAGTNPVRAWQFHPQFDVGRWITNWGAGPSGDYDNQLGITAKPDPRSLYVNGGWTERVNGINVSQDPTNASNHFLEGVLFRPHAAQIMQAPANQVAGPATINFDYWFNQWEDVITDADSIFHVWIGGVNAADLPDWQDRAGPVWGGAPPAGYNPIWDSPNWNTWGWAGIGDDKPSIGSQGMQWHSLSGMYPETTTFNLDTTYDYYYISVWMTTYSEGHPYFWLYGGKPTDRLAIGIDNIDFRVTVGNVRDPFLPGDMNLDGVVNVQDINPFVTALGSIASYRALIANYLIAKGLGTSPPELDAVIIEIDPNQDGVINVQDINTFVTMLAGNGVDADQLAVIPEPASLSLLTLGGLFLHSRSRRAVA